MDLSIFLNGIMPQMTTLIFLLSGALHLLLAIGVAKDVGNFNKLGIPTQIISGNIWILATLLGGIFSLFIYWLMHHSSLAKRPYMNYEKDFNLKKFNTEK